MNLNEHINFEWSQVSSLKTCILSLAFYGSRKNESIFNIQDSSDIFLIRFASDCRMRLD